MARSNVHPRACIHACLQLTRARAWRVCVERKQPGAGCSEKPEDERLGRALLLAVNWNRSDVAEHLLKRISLSEKGVFTLTHHHALQFTLEKQV